MSRPVLNLDSLQEASSGILTGLSGLKLSPSKSHEVYRGISTQNNSIDSLAYKSTIQGLVLCFHQKLLPAFIHYFVQKNNCHLQFNTLLAKRFFSSGTSTSPYWTSNCVARTPSFPFETSRGLSGPSTNLQPLRGSYS